MSRPSTPSAPRSSQSSSIHSLSPTHKLHRLAFQGEDSAHWALFLPAKMGSAFGLLVHIVVRRDPATGKPFGHELGMKRLDMVGTPTSEARVIPGAEVSEDQLRRAAEAVFYRPDNTYHLLTNNCQHFCIDVVTWLHQYYPNAVSQDAITDCEGKGTKPVALRKFIHWTRFTKEGREAHLRAKQAKEAQQAAAARPPSRDSARPRISIN